MTIRTTWPRKCALQGVSQHPDPPRGVSNESVRTVELLCPRAFPLSKVGASLASMVNGSCDCEMASVVLECSCSYRVCESQCEGECRLRALHVYRLHRQPTPVRQCPPAVRWLVKIAVTRNITSSMQMARRKTWPEGVAVRCGRKAWLKGVVLRRACRDRGRELSWLPVVSARSFGVQLHDNDPACIKATQGISSCA